MEKKMKKFFTLIGNYSENNMLSFSINITTRYLLAYTI